MVVLVLAHLQAVAVPEVVVVAAASARRTPVVVVAEEETARRAMPVAPASLFFPIRPPPVDRSFYGQCSASLVSSSAV